MNAKLLILLFGLLSTLSVVYGYKTCSKVSNNVDKCECYIRSQTELLNRNCGKSDIGDAAGIVYHACKNISYCLDAFAKNDNYCPLAKVNYGTTSCIEACIMDIGKSFEKNMRINPTCIRVKNDKSIAACNEVGYGKNLKICEWRME